MSQGSQPTPDDRSGDVAQMHQALVDQLVKLGVLSVPAVDAAFRAVPRHLFLPDVPPKQVYQDNAIPTKHEQSDQPGQGTPISSSSQPSMMAIMLQQLALEPGQRVLEIGTGTGYNAALMAHLVGPRGQIVSLDIDEDIVVEARAHLNNAGYEDVVVVQQDGALGYPALAPYDRIILTVAAWDILPAWREQLAQHGRLLVPLTLLPGLLQLSVAFEVDGDTLRSVSTSPCGFLPLRGMAGHPSSWEWSPLDLVLIPKAARRRHDDIVITIEKEWSDLTLTWQIGHTET
ncbi:MAG: methyltransferase domain-containing protein [Chloroflexi bacterium]|nr:methyltransferase domain-containing protein [Chloroflexota bacterium]